MDDVDQAVDPSADQPLDPPDPASDQAAELWRAFLDDPLDEQSAAEETERLTARLHRHDVTAVLVAHDGARWLPFALAALADLERSPRRILAVDTGSTDASPQMLADALGAASVLSPPKGATFGSAVAEAMGALGAVPVRASDPEAPVVEWIWLLHDDCAPEPDALHELLLEAERSPSAGVIGPKVRGWKNGRLLLELGVSIGRGGSRETYLEAGETDQGQHDARHDVLAVGSAGMLVRRDVWDALGGFSADLRAFRDDVDLCWRARRAGFQVVVAPAAVVHHAEAATHGRRPPAPTSAGPLGEDRRSALTVLLCNLPRRSLPWAYVRLTLGSILRVLLLLLEKAPGEAAQELSAWAAVVLRPDRVVAGRRRRSGSISEPWSSVRPYLAPAGTHLRRGVEALVGAVGAGRADAPSDGGLESGPAGDEADQMPTAGAGLLGRSLRRPGALVTLGLLLLALVAFRGLLIGEALQGGALLPAPAGASDLWQTFTQPWHSVSVGSSLAAPPWVGVVAVASVVSLAKPGLLLVLLFLLAVPLAGITAYVLLTRLTPSRSIRLWGAVAYALLPAVTGGIAAGRLGTVLVAWLLPLLVMAGIRVAPSSEGPPSWRTVAGTGLLLALLAAFVPMVWVAAVLIAAGGGLTSSAARAWWLRVGVLLLVPVVALVPWSWRLVTDPSGLLLEAGAAGPGLADPALPSWNVVLASPGGPGSPAAWITGGLVVAGFAALVISRRRVVVAVAWGVTLTGLLIGLFTTLIRVNVPSLGGDVTPWPGLATLLVGGGLIVAACCAAEEVGETLAGRSFGWRQPLAAAVVALAVLAPAAGAWSWVARGASEPLTRTDAAVVPAFVAAASQSDQRPSTLLLTGQAGRPVAYSILHGAGVTLGAADVAPAAAAAGPLDAVVEDLTSGRAGDDISARLLTYGAAYVLVTSPADPELVNALDAAPGLERLAASDGTALWEVAGAPTRLRIQQSDGTATPLPAGPVDATARIPAGDGAAQPSRVVALANAADPRWTALLDGDPLSPVPAGEPPASEPPVPQYAGATATWAQRFTLGADAGELQLTYDGTARTRWLMVQAAALLALTVVALPGRRRSPDEQDDAIDAGTGITATPREPRAPEPPKQDSS